MLVRTMKRWWRTAQLSTAEILLLAVPVGIFVSSYVIAFYLRPYLVD